jgi:hypothetical protein
MKNFNEQYKTLFRGTLKSILESEYGKGALDVLETPGDEDSVVSSARDQYFNQRNQKVSTLQNAHFILTKAGWSSNKPSGATGVVTYSKGPARIVITVDLIGEFSGTVIFPNETPVTVKSVGELVPLLKQ